MAKYLIEYSGICWVEESTTYTGDIPGLLREVDWIEERGGSSVTVTDQETGETVYEDGGLCQAQQAREDQVELGEPANADQ